VIVQPEVVSELVDHGVADLVHRVLARAGDAHDRAAEDRDLVGEQRHHVERAFGQRHAAIDAEELVLVVLFIVIVVLIFGMKLVPSFIEYRSARTAIEAIAAQNPASPAEARKAFDARAIIDDINSVKPADLDISKDGNQMVISFAYRKEVPLWGDRVGVYINYAAQAGGQ
jgi:hypothetical protein